MASSIKATPQATETPEKDVSETAPDSPLLDLSNAAVKKLIRFAKRRGYVTHDQIDSVLPSEEVIPSRSRTYWPCSARWA
jgi:RNA polymerase primary sigma factor